MISFFFILLICSIVLFKFKNNRFSKFFLFIRLFILSAFIVFIVRQLLKYEIKNLRNEKFETITFINRSNESLNVFLIDTVQNSSLGKISIGKISSNFCRKYNFDKFVDNQKILIAKDDAGNIKWADYLFFQESNYNFYSTDNLPKKLTKILSVELDKQNQTQKKHSILISLLCLLWVINVFLIFKDFKKN